MKTPYEKISRYGIDTYLFGKAKKKYRAFYWLLFLTYLLTSVLIQTLLA